MPPRKCKGPIDFVAYSGEGNDPQCHGVEEGKDTDRTGVGLQPAQQDRTSIWQLTYIKPKLMKQDLLRVDYLVGLFGLSEPHFKSDFPSKEATLEEAGPIVTMDLIRGK